MKTTDKRYGVIRDTRERKAKGWFFFETDLCSGMKTKKLDVGDYTLAGFEDIFTIERKGAVVEWVNNLTDKTKRLHKELERGRHLKHIFIALEFDCTTLLNYPKIEEVPAAVARQIRFTGFAALAKTLELIPKYPNVQILFVGPEKGLHVAGSVFKRMVENYGDLVAQDSPDTQS